LTTKNPDCAATEAYRYLTNRKNQLDYKGALEAKLPIGSGLIESGNRHVLQSRLKIPGAFWLTENAEEMAQLLVLRKNGGWEDGLLAAILFQSCCIVTLRFELHPFPDYGYIFC